MSTSVAIILLCLGASTCQLLEDIKDLDIENYELIEEDLLSTRAAPWWVQNEETRRKRCRSSCTEYSKGVRSYVNLCDDKEVTLDSKSQS